MTARTGGRAPSGQVNCARFSGGGFFWEWGGGDTALEPGRHEGPDGVGDAVCFERPL